MKTNQVYPTISKGANIQRLSLYYDNHIMKKLQ